MKTIGITGGVGCGKSSILKYISEKYNCRIILADDVANKLKEPGESCYQKMIDLLGEDIIDKQDELHRLDRFKIAQKIFSDEALLDKVNEIIHPAVKEYILEQKTIEENKCEVDYFFIEAALLIECGYNAYVDEMWYIYTSSQNRRDRLKSSRGYSDEKIDDIMASQLSEEEFTAGSDFVIDNNKDLLHTYRQIDTRLISA